MATTGQMISAIKAGEYDKALSKLYGSDLSSQKERYIRCLEGFAETFGEKEVRIYSAPGRTEIGGNHTDHNHGIVMAGAVNLDVVAVAAKNQENVIRVVSEGFGQIPQVDLACLEPVEAEMGKSAGLIRGVAAGVQQLGGKIGGFDAYCTSQVLGGSGLSSSAAFEVAMGAILRGEYNDNDHELLSQVEIAKISQYAENVFFGKPSGLMDQTACAVGSAITIDFADPANPIVNKVDFDLAGQNHVLCISDTKGSHADLTDDYAAIRREMEMVAEFFGKKVLREVPEEEVVANIPAIREKLGDRALLRALHFYNECRRAQELCQAVKENRFEDFKKLILDGGHSSFEYNQNAYSIKDCTQQGVAVGLAISQRVLQGKGAWRLQGGGFAGTIQAFVPVELLDEYRTAIDSVFGEGSCYVLSIRNYGAVQVTPDL